MVFICANINKFHYNYQRNIKNIHNICKLFFIIQEAKNYKFWRFSILNSINKAIIFAAKAHEGQYRKSTNIPYITHPFAVGMLLQQEKCSEEVIAAGILHDTIEDTDVSYEELVEHFGETIAQLVQAVSENDKSLPWEERKQRTINAISEASTAEIQIIIADKLHNLQSIRADLEIQGEDVWLRFNSGKQEQHWYYSSIFNVLRPRRKECRLIGKLEKEVKAVFGSLQKIGGREIDLLFKCAYGIDRTIYSQLDKKGLVKLAEAIWKNGEAIYRNPQNYESIYDKLDDLSTRGIQFQSNSDGPLLLASFCIALQQKMNWTDEELFKHFKRNLKNL